MTVSVQIREKRPGYYEARPSINGKQVSITGTLKEVKLQLSKTLNTRRVFKSKAKCMTLGEFLGAWIETQKQRVHEGSLEPQTYLLRESMLRNHVTHRLGHVQLASVDRAMVKEFFDGFRGDKSTRARQLGFETLRAACNDAVALDYLASNPCVSLGGGKGAKPFHAPLPKLFLRPDQVDSLLTAAQREGAPAYGYPLVLLAVTTGMRLGELLALHWDDVDLEDGWVTINWTISRDLQQRYYAKPFPKTRSSRRRIRLPQETVDGLRRWKATENGFVFATGDGTLIQPSNFRERVFYRATAAAGLDPDFTFHGLRHTHASELIAAGVNFKEIQARLGHSSIRITLDTYGHLIDDGQEAVKAALDSRKRKAPPAGKGQTRDTGIQPTA